jgi:tetratricopeptide (TPR) repeat protein
MDTKLDDFASALQRASEAKQSGDNQVAYEFYARASELNPNAAEAWRGRAATSTLADDALVSLAYAVALTPGDKILVQEFERRVQSRVGAAGLNDAPALIIFGQKFAEAGLLKEASLLFRRATEFDDTQEEGFIWLAATTGDPKEAASALKQAFVLNPKDLRIREGLVAVLAELNRATAPPEPPPPAPTPQARVAPVTDPGADLVRSGEQALASGDKTAAYQAFVRATELAPRNEGAWLGRARACEDIDETLTCLEQALAINPDNMQAREARTFYRIRKLREGVRKAQEPEEELPRFPPTFAGGGGFGEQPSPEVRSRRILLLVIMTILLLFLIAALAVRLQLI